MKKPGLLFLRFTKPDLPAFIRLHLQEQVVCLSQFFDVTVIDDSCCDYRQLCDRYKPDIALFESGIYVGRREVENVSAYPEIPKIGLIHCDAYCQSREYAICDMARWGISTFFTTSVSLGSYTPEIADNLFVWPNFVNTDIYHDYGLIKTIPVLFTGSQEISYPWRNSINKVVSQYYTTLQSPHFGWTGHDGRMLYGEKYAQIINASFVAPACGSIANEVVRKHFEIPACNTCLITQQTPTIEAAGFSDLVNCVFAEDNDILEKLDWLFQRPDELTRITQAGKELVESRHSIKNRDQIFQWYKLFKQLKSGQRIVQLGPFLPLSIVEHTSGTVNKHIMSRGVDRLLIAQGDKKLLSGHYDDAEILYRRCLNYHKMPEPVLRLAICQLYKGNSVYAIDILRRQILEVLENHDSAEPDPIEWAYFIVAFLCRGQIREAITRSNQFSTLHHQELDRVRDLIRLLSNHAQPYENITNYRASVHQLPKYATEIWLDNICRMLKACQQFEIAERLDGPTQILSRMGNHNGITNKESSRGYVFGPILDKCAIVTVRLWRRIKPIVMQLRMINGKGHFEDSLTIRNILHSNEINSGLLLGAAAGVWLTDAFLAGMDENPNLPSLVCMNNLTPRFVKLQEQLAKNPLVKCRHLTNSNVFENTDEIFDVIVIDGSELPELGKEISSYHQKLSDTDLIVIDDINFGIGYELYQDLLADKNYILLVHEPSCFAIFRAGGMYKYIAKLQI